MPGGYRYVSINDNDEVVFLAKLEDGSVGVFTGDAAIKAGDPAPDGGVYEPFHGNDGSDINDAGQIAFFARTTGADGTRRGLYAWDRLAPTPTLLTRAGVLGGIPVLREDGTVIYLGSVRTEDGQWYQAVLQAGANLSEEKTFARGGDPAPGGGTFAMGLGKFNFPSGNQDAPVEVAFLAELDTGEEGIFTSTHRIAQVNDTAPIGGTFTDFSGTPSINNPGRVVYAANTSDALSGIFDTHGNPVVISGETVFDGAPLLGPADPVLTNDGQVVFYAHIRDGAGERRGGLFIARKVRIAPAP
jgi:hypothetical protein